MPPVKETPSYQSFHSVGQTPSKCPWFTILLYLLKKNEDHVHPTKKTVQRKVVVHRVSVHFVNEDYDDKCLLTSFFSHD